MNDRFPFDITAWQVGWIKTLVTQYRQEHNWEADEDPTATAEMLREATHVADELSKVYRQCAGCHVEDALQGGDYCQQCQYAENTRGKTDPAIPF